ncbi:MAG: NADP-dependent isocitrate dehydrogenase [Spirochaetes bacterium]|nr:NADP-dependent isocitrate dehydrogenase [Spirochaetota bacterium]
MADPITMTARGLVAGNHPRIPFIEGDGIGPDIWRAARAVLDAAVAKAYAGRRAVAWEQVYAGEQAFRDTGEWLPAATEQAFRDRLVGIKGPLATPVGGGIRSLNVALRQRLDLYVCLRPVRWFPGVPSPVRHPELVDMVVFRENTEDVYAGYELAAGTDGAVRLADFLGREYGWRIGPDTGIGIKPVSRAASERLVRAALRWAIDHGRRSVTLVHKGNIQKYTEGAFRQWGYDLARREFGDRVTCLDGAADADAAAAAATATDGSRLVVKDAIADSVFQQLLTRPEEYDVLATTNLNGDYLSDALAAQVGGIGIAPGANINYVTGHAVFEATHGTAPKYAGKDMANPCSLILSGAMMLDYLGWPEAARLVEEAVARTIGERFVTYDFARAMEGAVQASTSAFGERVAGNLG